MCARSSPAGRYTRRPPAAVAIRGAANGVLPDGGRGDARKRERESSLVRVRVRGRRRRPGGLLAYQDVGEVWYECTIVEKDEPLERGDRCLAGNP
eukprot:2261705-Pyramimonas_sp.AAC.1